MHADELPGVRELRQRLESLEAHCLTGLGAGLETMRDGDLTVHVAPATTPYEPCRDPRIDALDEVFNRMAREGPGRPRPLQRDAYRPRASGAERQVHMVDAAKRSTEQTASSADQARSVAGEGVTATHQATQAISSVRESSGALVGAMEQLSQADRRERPRDERVDRADPVGHRRGRRGRRAGLRRHAAGLGIDRADHRLQEIASSAQMLARSAEELDGLVGRFKVAA